MKENPVRAKYRKLVEHRLFELTVFLVIIYSCILMVVADPNKDEDAQAMWIRVSVWCVGASFLVELLLKLAAFGARRYFRDPWNWIDFAVVCESIVSAVFAVIKALAPASAVNAGAIRILSTFRALRPLRSAQFLPPVRLLIQTFVGSFGDTGALLLVMLIQIFIAAGVGQVFFRNQLSHRCFSDAGVSYDEKLYCSPDGSLQGGTFRCPQGFSCRDSGANPHLGVSSFDNLPEALITCFEIASTKGWEIMTFHLQDGYSKFAWLFTVTLVFVTNCVVLNLFPAILTTKFYTVLLAYNAMLERKRKAREALLRRLGMGGHEALVKGEGEGGGEEDMGLGPTYTQGGGRAEFRRILQRFEDAEKEDMRMIQRTLDKESTSPPDPLLSHGRTRLPFLAPSCLFCAEWRASIVREGGPFMNLVYTAILLNCFTLAVDQYPNSPLRVQVVYVANVLFTSLFLLEMVVKLLVFGPVVYVLDGWNVFDGLVTLLTTASLFLRSLKLVVILRVIRLAKLITLARASSLKQAFSASTVLDPIMDLPRIMGVLSSTVSFAFYLVFLLLLFTFIFAVVGRTYLWGTLNVSEFGSFPLSFITMFRLISGDGFDELVHECVAQGGNSFALFPIVWVMLSRWFMLSFVTAMILYYVDLDGREYLAYVARSTTISVCKMEAALTRVYKRISFASYRQALQGNVKSYAKVNLISEPDEERVPNPCLSFWTSSRTFGLFDEDSRVRGAAAAVVDHPAFQNLVLCMILAGSVTMTIQLDAGAQHRKLPPSVDLGFNYLDWAITLVFLLELLLYSLGRGLFHPKTAYLREGVSNVVDFGITITSVANLLVELTQGDSGGQSLAGIVKILRVLRVFRVIRLATRSKVTRLILASFTTAGRAVLAVAGIVSVCVVVFAILGIQLFAGRFHKCTNPLFPSGGYHDRAYTGFPNGCTDGWVNAPLSYDSFSKAMLSSIVCFSLDGWEALLESAINLYGVGRNPDTSSSSIHSPWNALYFMVYNCIIYLVTPLFVGVLYGTFLYSIYVDGDLRKRLASIRDAEWAVYRMKLSSIQPFQMPSRPMNWRRRCYDLVSSTRYKAGMAFLVVLHCVMREGFYADQMAEFWASPNPAALLPYRVGPAFNVLAISLYLLDTFVLRLMGLGIRGITVSILDKLDLFVTMVLLVQLGAACQGQLQLLDPIWQKVIDALTVLRVLKVLSSMTRTRQLFGVVVIAMPGACSILILIVCIIYIYAVFGVIALSDLQLFPDDAFYSRHYRFDSVSSTMLMLASVVTGDDWTIPMTETAARVDPRFRWAVFAYFCSLLMACKFVFFNMFLLVVLQVFEGNNEEKTGLAMAQVYEFKRAWQIFDERGTGSMKLRHLPLLLRRLGEPLGTSRRMPLADATRVAQKLCYIGRLSKLRREAEEVALNRDKAMKDPAKRKVLAIVDHDKAFLETLEGGGGYIRSLEDLAWAQTPVEMSAQEHATQKVTFAEVIVTAHQNAIFRPRLADENEYQLRRRRAQEYAGLLREAVWGLVNQARLGDEGLKVRCLTYMVTMQRHSPASFRQRLPLTLTAAFESWASRVASGVYNQLLHVEGRLLLLAGEGQLKHARDQMALLQQASSEDVEDATFYPQDIDELRKLSEALDRTLKQIKELRAHYVDVVWELDDPPVESVQQLRIPQCSINALALTADADLLLVGDSDGTVRVFRKKDPAPAEPDSNPSSQTGSSNAAAPVPTAPKFRYVYVSEVSQESPVLSLAVSPDGRRFFTAGKDGYIRAWTRESSAVVKGGDKKEKGGERKGEKKKGAGGPRRVYAQFALKEVMQGHKGEVYALEFCGPNFLFSAGQDGVLRMWAVPSTTSLQSCPVPNIRGVLGNRPLLFCVCVFDDPDEDLDGSYVATGGSDGILSVFVFKTDPQWAMQNEWRPQCTIEAFNGRAVTAVSFSWRRLYTAGSDGSLRLWDVQFAYDPATKDKTGIAGLSLVVTMPCHSGPVSALGCFGGLLFSSSHDFSIIPWLEPTRQPDAKDPEKYNTVQDMRSGLVCHTDPITCMAGNGRLMVTGDVKGGVVVRVPALTRERIKTGVRLQKQSDVGKGRRSALEIARSMVERYPALAGAVEDSPDFINEQLILSLDPDDATDPQASQHPKTFLSMLLHHTFPPRVVGRASVVATSPSADVANAQEASRPASPVAKVTNEASPSSTLLSPFGLTFGLTGRFGGEESVHNPALRGALDVSKSNTPLA